MTIASFILIMLATAAIVYFTRLLPFLFAKQLRDNKLALLMGRSLPLAIMLLLTLHGVRTSAKLNPAMIGVAVTALVHLSFKQPIISIIVGTASYVALIHYMPYLPLK